MTNLRKIAEELKLDLAVVRDVLREVPGRRVAKTVQDRIFSTARKLGYDLAKLKIGKRMSYQREALMEILRKIEGNPDWGRAEILAHLRNILGLVVRVQRRVFQDEYGEDWL